MPSTKRILNFVRTHKRHIYPVLLTTALVTLTCLQLSGSSVGIYNQLLYGNKKRDPSLVVGSPKLVRSDEWLVTTQLTVAQKEADFPRINKSFNGGEDMSIITDVPYKDWSVLFKPQNLIFFVLPLTFAFAFKWWLLLYLLLMGSYYFTLRLLPKKYWLAIGSSLLIGCSPFVFWWYQTITIAPLFYAFFIMLASMNIIDNKSVILFGRSINNKVSTFVRVIVLSYLLVAFGLVLYPAFQVPTLLCAGFFLVGYLLNRLLGLHKKEVLIILGSLITAATLALFVGFIFIHTHSKAINSIESTSYPGKRDIHAGGYDITNLLTTYLQPQLQRSKAAYQYILNQSESSSFIVLPLFFIIPISGLWLWLYIKRRRIDWVITSLLLCAGLFFAHLFIPASTPLSKLFLLYLVPQSRLLIGLGLLAILMLVYSIKVVEENDIHLTRTWQVSLVMYSLIFLLISVLAGLDISRRYPGFVSNKFAIAGLAVLLTGSLSCFLFRKYRLGVSGLVFLTILSTFNVLPLYRGLGPLTNSDIAKTIKSISSPSNTWATDTTYFENLPQIVGRSSITGVSFIPNTAFWQQYSTPSDELIYNRYAHITAGFNSTTPLVLRGQDSFTASAKCNQKITHKIDYVVSTQLLDESCVHLLKTLSYPSTTVYFYRVSH